MNVVRQIKILNIAISEMSKVNLFFFATSNSISAINPHIDSLCQFLDQFHFKV